MPSQNVFSDTPVELMADDGKVLKVTTPDTSLVLGNAFTITEVMMAQLPMMLSRLQCNMRE